MDQRYNAVVVRSSFGGPINALRLAQAARSVLVLERGKCYLTHNAFPANGIRRSNHSDQGELATVCVFPMSGPGRRYAK